MTVTPVLADQLEAEGVGERILRFLRRHRSRCRQTAMSADAGAAFARRAKAEADHYTRGDEAAAGSSGAIRCAPSRTPTAEGRVALMASAATHAVLPKLATLAGRRLQVDAGLRSHERRFGEPGGILAARNAPMSTGSRPCSPSAASPTPASTRARRESGTAALAPIAWLAAPVAFTIDWPTVQLVWSIGGYPAEAAPTSSTPGSRPTGCGLWSIPGNPYDPAAAAKRATEHAASFLAAVRDRLERHRAERGRRGLCVFAIDTELLGHWWCGGPDLAAGGAEGRRARRGSPAHPASGSRRASRARSVRSPGELGGGQEPARPGTRPRSPIWSGPPADPSCALLRALGDARRRASTAALSAARELLALQSSDWAFMDHRGQAGDYPYTRATAPRSGPAGGHRLLARQWTPACAISPLI